MLADHMDRLLSSSYCLIFESSVGLSAGIQSAGDSVPETLVPILQSTEEDNLSPFDCKIACLCHSIEINDIKCRLKDNEINVVRRYFSKIKVFFYFNQL